MLKSDIQKSFPDSQQIEYELYNFLINLTGYFYPVRFEHI